MVNYTYNGKTLICDPLKLNVFRAGTENDKAQTGDWNKMGLRDLTVRPGEWSIQKGSNSVDLYITNVYKAANPHTFITQLSFKVAADGTIFVNSTIDPTMKNVVLPKIGYILEMPAGFENFTWFGRGPWDSYEDRKEACFEGIYNSTVKEQWTGYVLPQEMGNKEDVRWMTLTNNAGDGLLFIAPDQMDASVAHWRPEDMILDRSGNRIKHPYQMKFRENTVVSLDARNRALGNASCGADVMDKYELKAEYTLFNFMIQPLEKKYTNDELAQKARVKSPICNPVKIDQNEKGKSYSLQPPSRHRSTTR